jgi:hypothetical protein
MSKGITLEDCAAVLGISVPQAANLERAGSLPFVRVTERNGAFYFVEPGVAVDLHKAGKQTGYTYADDTAQRAAIAAADRRLQVEQDAARAVNREKNEAAQAKRNREAAAYDAALTAAGSMRQA